MFLLRGSDSDRTLRARRLCRLTNYRDFPVPRWPHCDSRHGNASMGSANAHQPTRKGKSMAIGLGAPTTTPVQQADKASLSWLALVD